MSACPSLEQLQRLLADQVDGSEAQVLEAHVEACAACQQTLEHLTANTVCGDSPAATTRDQAPPSGPGPECADAGGTLRLKSAGPTAGAPRKWPAVAGYEVLAELGRGGMGVVYQARHVKLNRLVALKMILGGSHAGAQELARFRREAEAVARLQHPHIVQIYEVGEVEGRPFLSLEFVAGGSLAEKLDGTPQPCRPAAQLVETLAKAMHYAHQCGIVHRDLKPANILLDCRLPIADCRINPVDKETAFPKIDNPKITDFGLAKLLDSEQGHTQTGLVLGTPSYMAPEQAGGKTRDIGPAADVYALGAILYELVTGRPPFKGKDPLETLQQVVSQDPVMPSRLQPKVPRDLETICLRCLEKEPDRRYARAQELAEDLARFLNHEPILARPVRLWERGLRWARRRPAALLTGLVILLLLAGSVGGYWLWQRTKEAEDAAHRAAENRQKRRRDKEEARAVKVEYFAHYIRRWGDMEGVEPVTPEQVRQRHLTYKFYRRGGQTVRVDIVNVLGQPTGNHAVQTFLDSPDRVGTKPRQSSYHFERDDKGRLTEELGRDRRGRVMWKLHYTTPTTAHYTDPQGFPSSRAPSGAAYVQFAWSNKGFKKQIWYLDGTGHKKPDPNGVSGEHYEPDKRGLVRRITYVDGRGLPTLSKDRIAGYTAQYDEHANQTEVAYFGVQGRPALHKNGYCRRTAKYDARGNCIVFAYFGLQGRPIMLKAGYHRFTLGYDERGNCIEHAYFGLDGRPTLIGSGYHRWSGKHDERGNLVEGTYFDTSGRPTLNKGIAKLTRAYDDRGNMTAEAYFGLDGKPTLLKGGYSKTTMAYDVQGNRIGQAYFGLDGKLILLPDGYAKWVRAYDGQGNPRELAYFGADSRPVLYKNSYHKWTAKYDERRNKIEQAYFDAGGKPAMHKDDNHRWTAKYNERGHQVELAYFGVDGKPVLNSKGTAKITKSYDQQGKLTGRTFWILDHDGAYIRSWRKKDGQGRTVEEAYIFSNGKPAYHKEGYHKWTAYYDENGNRLETAYFGIDGRPALTEYGYAKLTWVYDKRKKLMDTVAFDAQGKLVPLQVVISKITPDGVAQRTGLQEGDVLLKYDGQQVLNVDRFVNQRRGEPKKGAPRSLVVLRNGKELTFGLAPGLLGATVVNRQATPAPKTKPE